MIIKEKTIELKGDIQSDKITFKAVLNDNKVLIKRTEISDTPECNVKEFTFCDYLKTEEVEIFFDNINISEYIMKNADFGTHYRYGENPKIKYIDVFFTLPTGEVFSDGLWWNEEIDELFQHRDDAK